MVERTHAMDGHHENVSTLQTICQTITHQRAQELLEAANGNLERAVDIFFHQQQEEEQEQEQHHEQADVVVIEDSEILEPATLKQSNVPQSTAVKKRSPKGSLSPSKTDRKQPRLDTFFNNMSQRKQYQASTDSVRNPKPQPDFLEDNQNKNDPQPRIHIHTSDIPSTTDVITIDEENNIDKIPSSTLSIPFVSNPKSTILTNVSFQRLAETLQQLMDTTKRLVKLAILKDFVDHIRQQDHLESKSKTLTCGLLLLLGFRGDQPLDVGGSALSKALQTILGASRMQLSKGYRQYGDLGDAAASLFQKKTFFVSTSTKSLTILQVYERFQKIVATEGRDAKQHILLQLLRACNSKTEIRFLVRLLIGNMRVGANLKTVLAAVAMAFVPDNKKAIEVIQKTHDVCPNLESIISALLEGGLEQVQRDCQIQLLTPIAPMLAHPIHSLDQVAKAMISEDGQPKSMTMEWKYDGVRCQAHYDGTTIKLFSRHMLETTAQYPDAAKSILDARRDNQSVHSFIMDAEIVGVECEGENVRLLPFQDLSRRKKKNDDGQGVRVKVFCFDLMYLNGVSYIDKSLQERQTKMLESFQETKDFAYVSSQPLPTFDENCICSFLEQAVEKGAEGLMLKLLGSSTTIDNDNENENNMHDTKELQSKGLSPYEAGTRSHSWLKVKRDYVAGYADTIDVVPIGAWYGHGRKAQKSFLSPVLLAVYDEEEDVYRSISRCMSFTDAMYDAMREFYFRGTPYPPTVGMDGTEVRQKDDTQNLGVVEEEEEDDDDENSSSDENEDQEVPRDTPNDGTVQDGDSMVHCFQHRPSSAYIVTNESPPIWFQPREVFEVSFADMSLSRQHTAGAGLVEDLDGRGVALRFPRFKRRRPDKKPQQATTSLQIAQLFSQQSKQASNSHSRR